METFFIVLVVLAVFMMFLTTVLATSSSQDELLFDPGFPGEDNLDFEFETSSPGLEAVEEKNVENSRSNSVTYKKSYKKPYIKEGTSVRVFNPNGDFFDRGKVVSRGTRRARIETPQGVVRRSVLNLEIALV